MDSSLPKKPNSTNTEDFLPDSLLAVATQLTGALKLQHKNGINGSVDLEGLIESIPKSGAFIDQRDADRENVARKIQERSTEITTIDHQLRAPELLIDGVESRAADVFYVAALLVCLCLGKLPEHHPEERDAWLKMATAHSLELRPLSQMLISMLSPEPSSRPQANIVYDVFEHIFLQSAYGDLTQAELEALSERVQSEGEIVLSSGQEAPERHYRLLHWLRARLDDLGS